MVSTVRRYLRSRKNRPSLVHRYFLAPTVKYAAGQPVSRSP